MREIGQPQISKKAHLSGSLLRIGFIIIPDLVGIDIVPVVIQASGTHQKQFGLDFGVFSQPNRNIHLFTFKPVGQSIEVCVWIVIPGLPVMKTALTYDTQPVLNKIGVGRR